MNYEQSMKVIAELEARIATAEKEKAEHEHKDNQLVALYIEGKITGLTMSLAVILNGVTRAARKDAAIEN